MMRVAKIALGKDLNWVKSMNFSVLNIAGKNVLFVFEVPPLPCNEDDFWETCKYWVIC